MENKIYCYSLLFFVFALSCNSTTKKKHGIAEEISTKSHIEQDTIKAMGFTIPNKKNACSLITNKFHKKFGVFISDYYIILDSLNVDLNNDKVIDKILVLSPLSLESEESICKTDTLPKRLLVEIINNKNTSKIRNTYSNLISDTGGVLSHYNGCFLTSDGFEIIHQAGAKYSWTYKMIFSVRDKNQIKLKSIDKACTLDGVDKNLKVDYKNVSVDKINVSDTLKVNCNCDKYWEELENKI
jgi:hypothetical protein